MMDWAYVRGEWKEIEPPVLAADGEDVEKPWRRAGYGIEQSFGDRSGLHIELYSREQDRPWPFMLMFSTASYWYSVWIADLPSLVMALREMLPVIQQDLEIEQLMNVLDHPGR